MVNAKNLLMTLIVVGPCWASYAQGTVRFANYSSPGGPVNAPVYQADGVTPLSGSQFMAELLGGPSAANLSFVAATGFLTGAGAGYFYGGTSLITNVPPLSTAWVQVEVWNTQSGTSFAQAKASGLPDSWWESSTFTITAGGGGGTTFPPADLVDLGTSPVFLNNAVPEPSPLALCMLAGLLATIRFWGAPRRCCGLRSRHRK